MLVAAEKPRLQLIFENCFQVPAKDTLDHSRNNLFATTRFANLHLVDRRALDVL